MENLNILAANTAPRSIITGRIAISSGVPVVSELGPSLLDKTGVALGFDEIVDVGDAAGILVGCGCPVGTGLGAARGVFNCKD